MKSTSRKLFIVIGYLCLFGISIVLWFHSRPLYGKFLGLFGVTSLWPTYVPFFDTEGLFAALRCGRLSYDVFVQNPCDPEGRVFNYSPIWLWLARTPFDETSRPAVGTILALVFMISSAATALTETPRQFLYTLAVALSPPAVMAIERGNMDLVIFPIMAVGCFLISRRDRAFIGYSLIYVAAVLKFYPSVAFCALFRERPIHALSLAGIFGAALAGFVLWQSGSLAEVSVSRGPPLDEAFGGLNVFAALEQAVARLRPGWDQTLPVVFGAAFLFTALALMAAALIYSRRLAAAPSFQRASRLHALLFLAGASVTLFTFVVAQNPPYRAIFLLLTLPYLLSQVSRQRDSAARLAALTLVLIFLVSWFETIHWQIRCLTGSQEAADLAALLIREPAWWLLYFCLAAFLWAELAQGPAVKYLTHRIRPRRPIHLG